MPAMIELDGLTKRFGALLAVDNLSLKVESGEVLGFLGPNGAGKSTAMKMVSGFLAPTSGTAKVCGFDVGRDPVAVKSRIGYMPEGAPSYGDMTTLAFLEFIAEVRGYDGAERKRRVDLVIGKVELDRVLHQSIETLSKGFKRRVGLAQALLHDPDVLILDEPTDGLDPNQKHLVRTLIREMAPHKAIVISTHILEEVEAVCTRAVIIARGRLLADGTPEQLLARDPNHHAVVLKVANDKVAAAHAALRGLPRVHDVQAVGQAGGWTRLRVVPKDGQLIAIDVGNLLREQAIAVDELYVDRGELDDVFRTVTTDAIGAGGRHA
jgi:ABC-2 type transport system ATP-binding protein